MTLVGNPEVLREDFRFRALQGAFRCDECRFWSIGLAIQRDEGISGRYGDAREFLEQHATDIVWQPLRGTSKEFPDVPAHIADAASEAHTCRSVEANRGAVLLARAVIEATAKAKQITRGNLAAKIDALCEKGFIREHIKEAAHEARHLGNDMAHGDFDQAVDAEGAGEVLDQAVDAEGADEVLVIMDEVLAEVFQSPARTARLRAKREAKNPPPTSGQ